MPLLDWKHVFFMTRSVTFKRMSTQFQIKIRRGEGPGGGGGAFRSRDQGKGEKDLAITREKKRSPSSVSREYEEKRDHSNLSKSRGKTDILIRRETLGTFPRKETILRP